METIATQGPSTDYLSLPRPNPTQNLLPGAVALSSGECAPLRKVRITVTLLTVRQF